MVQLGFFSQGVDLFALQILRGQGRPPSTDGGQIRNSIYSSRRAIKITSYNDRHIALSNEVKVPMNRKSHFVTGKNTLALE